MNVGGCGGCHPIAAVGLYTLVAQHREHVFERRQTFPDRGIGDFAGTLVGNALLAPGLRRPRCGCGPAMANDPRAKSQGPIAAAGLRSLNFTAVAAEPMTTREMLVTRALDKDDQKLLRFVSSGLVLDDRAGRHRLNSCRTSRMAARTSSSSVCSAGGSSIRRSNAPCASSRACSARPLY